MLDVLILGGGINGAGVARDLALRAKRGGVPLRIGLAEQRHFASGTSGKNSQLIHGGLRYLKYLEFGLVRESLRERKVLLELAPHLVQPLPFVIPIYSWGARLFYSTGLLIYDLLAGSGSLGRHRNLSRGELAAMEPGLSSKGMAGGALFYDCHVNSARFVLENIIDAAQNGAAVANYVRAGALSPATGDAWSVELEDAISGRRFEARARQIVDARGPWGAGESLRLVRGSHVVLPRLNAGDHAIAWFDDAGRIVFLVPWGSRKQLTLLGTTDVDHSSGPDDVRISREEMDYLLGVAAKLFPRADLTPISAYSSLRPLLRDVSDSPTAASREHRIWRSGDGIVHIAGGKYTTYRLMSEEAADLVTGEIAPSLAALHLTGETPLRSTAGFRMEEQPVEAQIAQSVNHEMAQRLADFVFVSTYIGYEQRWNEDSLRPYAAGIGRLLGWNRQRIDEEIALVLRIGSLP